MKSYHFSKKSSMSMQLFDLNTTKTFFYKYILSENTNSIQPEPELQNFKWSASQSTVLVHKYSICSCLLQKHQKWYTIYWTHNKNKNVL